MNEITTSTVYRQNLRQFSKELDSAQDDALARHITHLTHTFEHAPVNAFSKEERESRGNVATDISLLTYGEVTELTQRLRLVGEGAVKSALIHSQLEAFQVDSTQGSPRELLERAGVNSNDIDIDQESQWEVRRVIKDHRGANIQFYVVKRLLGHVQLGDAIVSLKERETYAATGQEGSRLVDMEQYLGVGERNVNDTRPPVMVARTSRSSYVYHP